MNGQHLSSILQAVPDVSNKLYGVFRQEHLPPYVLPKGSLTIVNTDMHWCVLYIPRNGHIEYFDPLGKIPTPEVSTFIRIQKLPYIYNNVRVQGPRSVACGSFCIVFSVMRLGGVKFDCIINMFSRSYFKNDQIVKDFVDSLIY